MNYAKFAFTDAIKALQEGLGSRKAYEKVEKNNVVDGLSDNEIAFYPGSGQLLHGHLLARTAIPISNIAAVQKAL